MDLTKFEGRCIAPKLLPIIGLWWVMEITGADAYDLLPVSLEPVVDSNKGSVSARYEIDTKYNVIHIETDEWAMDDGSVVPAVKQWFLGYKAEDLFGKPFKV